jgi:hypothetical protein
MFKRKSECQKVKGLLSPYIDQQLSSAEEVLVKGHLARCPVCSADVESLRSTVNLLHRVPIVSPPRSFALARVEPRRRLAPFAVASTATAFAVSAMAFFFAGDAFNIFESRVIDGMEEGVRQATPAPAPPTFLEADDALGVGKGVAEIAEKWPVWQIEIALIGAVVVLAAVSYFLWRRRRRMGIVSRGRA